MWHCSCNLSFTLFSVGIGWLTSVIFSPVWLVLNMLNALKKQRWEFYYYVNFHLNFCFLFCFYCFNLYCEFISFLHISIWTVSRWMVCIRFAKSLWYLSFESYKTFTNIFFKFYNNNFNPGLLDLQNRAYYMIYHLLAHWCIIIIIIIIVPYMITYKLRNLE